MKRKGSKGINTDLLILAGVIGVAILFGPMILKTVQGALPSGGKHKGMKKPKTKKAKVVYDADDYGMPMVFSGAGEYYDVPSAAYNCDDNVESC